MGGRTWNVTDSHLPKQLLHCLDGSGTQEVSPPRVHTDCALPLAPHLALAVQDRRPTSVWIGKARVAHSLHQLRELSAALQLHPSLGLSNHAAFYQPSDKPTAMGVSSCLTQSGRHLQALELGVAHAYAQRVTSSLLISWLNRWLSTTS